MPIAVFFSLEGALLRGELQRSFVCWAALRGDLPFSWWARGAFTLARRRFSRPSAGADLGAPDAALVSEDFAPRIERAAAAYFATRGAARLRLHARPLVAAHRRCGHVTVLVASASEPVTRPLARALHFDALLATPLAVDGSRYPDGSFFGPDRSVEKRARVREFCLERGLELGQSYAYASRLQDADWLETVGMPIAVNPGRAVRHLAAVGGWRVIDLDSRAPRLHL